MQKEPKTTYSYTKSYTTTSGEVHYYNNKVIYTKKTGKRGRKKKTTTLIKELIKQLNNDQQLEILDLCKSFTQI